MSQAGILNLDNIPPPPGSVVTLTGNTGGSVPPNASGNINTVGATLYTVTGNPSTNTLTINPLPNAYPITPYVVGPIGAAGYQTIQSAINAANAAGGGVVYIQPGSYSESLTLYSGVHLYGTPAVSQNQGASVTITGIHTPPSSGQVAINSVCFLSTTNVFSSSAAGTTHLAFLNCESAVENGYFLNLPNWTGILEIYDNNSQTAGSPYGSIEDGGINNTGGATILIFSAGVGAGTTNTMNLSGLVIAQDMSFGCPVNFQTGSNIQCEYAIFDAAVTCSNNSTGFFRSCHFEPSTSVAALTMSSSAAIEISDSIINTSHSPSIAGSGSGTLTLGDVTFVSNAVIANTLTLAGATGFYPTLGTNGQVFLGATGLPGKFGTLTSSDGSVTFTTGANSLSLQVTGGTSVGKTISGQSGGALSPSSGNWNIVGNGVSSSGTSSAGNIYTTGSGSTLTINSTEAQYMTNYTSVAIGASPYSALATDYYISCVSSGGAITIKLPNAPTTNRLFIIKDNAGDASTNNISVTTVGGTVTIDGQTTYKLAGNYAAINLLFNGTGYEVF